MDNLSKKNNYANYKTAAKNKANIQIYIQPKRKQASTYINTQLHSEDVPHDANCTN